MTALYPPRRMVSAVQVVRWIDWGMPQKLIGADRSIGGNRWRVNPGLVYGVGDLGPRVGLDEGQDLGGDESDGEADQRDGGQHDGP